MRHHRLMKRIRENNPYAGLRGVVSRELRRFRADGPLKVLLLVIMPFFAFLFCAFYGTGTVADLPVAIADHDRSTLSRTMIRAIDATKTMRVIAQVNSVEEIERGIVNGKFVAGFVFPEGMFADVKSSRQVFPQLFCNGTSYLASTLIIRESQTVARTIGAAIVKTRLVKSGLSETQAMALVSPVIVDASNLYNQTVSYRYFLSPGLIFAQIGAMIMFAGAVCFARERERNSLGRLRRRARSSTWSALHGKSLPYMVYLFAICTLVLFVLFPLYHIAEPYETVKIIPGVILFYMASWWIGALVGTISGQVMVGASLSVGIGMPSFLFSGWAYPLTAAPELYSWIAAALPFTHFMNIWFGTVRKGFGPFACGSDLLILLAMAIAAHAAVRMLLKHFWNGNSGSSEGSSLPAGQVCHE